MKVKIEKASDWSYEEIVEVKDWNELIEMLRSRYNHWIIYFPKVEGMYITVTMYDDYVE
jgi:hypothetical protein